MLPIAWSAAALFLEPRATAEQTSVKSSASLLPLPADLRSGLTAVSIFGLLSFVSAVVLLCILCYRLIVSRRSHLHRNQFFLLILNLLVADVEQAVAFWLNITWLRLDRIVVGTPTCWAQGFFVSIGDLSSGVFTLLIALHTFVDIVFDHQISYRKFLATIVCAHIFVWLCAALAIALHPSDIYVRAGAWCWINSRYEPLRLWLHYLWILLAEFGTVLLYSALFLILRHRLQSSFYSPAAAAHARAAARAIIPYPVVYVICTLPLASARISSMAGRTPTYPALTFAGAMITSNGWLDVALYSLTRRTLIFGPAPLTSDMRALDTFAWPAAQGESYGTTTTIAGGDAAKGGSTEELVHAQVRMRKEVAISSAPVELRPRTKDAVSVGSKRSLGEEDEF